MPNGCQERCPWRIRNSSHGVYFTETPWLCLLHGKASQKGGNTDCQSRRTGRQPAVPRESALRMSDRFTWKEGGPTFRGTGVSEDTSSKLKSRTAQTQTPKIRKHKQTQTQALRQKKSAVKSRKGLKRIWPSQRVYLPTSDLNESSKGRRLRQL